MKPERLRQVANVLDVVLELDESMRASYLDAVGAGDRELQAAVEAHLEEITGGGVTSGDAASSSDNFQGIGSRVGPYRIVEHLGVGGMGTVYLAEREDEQFERQVAVKVLRTGFDSPELIRRFVAERQILAHLEHPHIARLYDGGTTPDGRPYLAMEYVDGLPIDRYCDEHKLDVEARLEVLRKVCGAVQFAHRHLVVHRDLKPSNILVDGDGEPRLLDFGVAKLLDPSSFPMTIEATRPGLSPMTPHYASPEQVSGDAITTATDVYALGVLLYRLLAGRLPFHFPTGSRERILEVLEKAGPTRPSQVVVEDSAGDLEPLPIVLGLAPSELQRQIAGDLDSITLKALRPEPEHRYSSPEQIALDIERHLSGLPVFARKDTWRYRAGKFVRRHRFAAGIAGTTVALLALLAVFMTWQAARVSEERNAAIAARDEARTAQQAEAEVVEFLASLFEKVDPRKARGEELTARQLLDLGRDKVQSELSDRPSVQSRLLLTMADVYHQLGLYQESIDLAAQSAVVLEESGAAPEIVNLSRRTEATGLLMLGKLDEASALLDRIEAELDDPAELDTFLSNTRGLIALQGGQFAQAAALLEETVRRHRLKPDPDAEAVARSLSNLAWARERLGEPEKAEASYREALELARRQLGDDHPMVATSLNNLGACLKDQGRIDEAADAYRQALELRLRVLGEEHLQTAQTRANLAILEAEAGRWRDAVPAFQRTIDVFEKHLGEQHPHVAMAWNNLGQCYRQLGEHELAEKSLARGLEAITASIGGGHPIASQNRIQQAILAVALARPAETEEHLSHVESLIDKANPSAHPLFTGLQAARCRALVARNDDGAIGLCQDALQTNHRVKGGPHRSSLTISADLVQALVSVGQIQEALTRLEEAEVVAQQTTHDEHPHRIDLLVARGDVHRVRGQADPAIESYRRALEVADLVSLTESHPLRLRAQSGLKETGGL